MSKRKLIGVFCCAAAMVCATAEAQLISGQSAGFDFGTGDGSAADWNIFASEDFDTMTTTGVAVATLAGGSVIDSSGSTVTGVGMDVRITFHNTFITNNGAEDNNEFPGQPSFPNEALGDWFGFRDVNLDEGGGLIELTISGLDDSLTYTIIVGSANDIDNDRADTIWSVDGGTSQSTAAGTAAAAYVTFSGVSTGGDGTLVLTGTAGGSVDPIAAELGFVSALLITADGGGSSLLGDFNGDEAVDCADLDSYVGNLVQPATGAMEELDLNDDGQVTIDDANLHITTLVVTQLNGVTGTFPADLNCDGTVDVLGDAFALVGNLGNVVTSYSDGDINFDGTVNVLGDAFVLVGNLGMTNDP